MKTQYTVYAYNDQLRALSLMFGIKRAKGSRQETITQALREALWLVNRSRYDLARVGVTKRITWELPEPRTERQDTTIQWNVPEDWDINTRLEIQRVAGQVGEHALLYAAFATLKNNERVYYALRNRVNAVPTALVDQEDDTQRDVVVRGKIFVQNRARREQ